MRKIFLSFFALLMCFPYLLKAQQGLYVGGGLGYSLLSTKRTLGWDQDAHSDVFFAEGVSKTGSGFDDAIFVGWRGFSGSLILGGEGQIGYGLQKQKFREANPNDPNNIFVSNVSEKLHLSVFGFVGVDVSGWGLFFKTGFVGSQIAHEYQELEGDNVTDSQKKASFSPGLGVGFMVEKPLSDQLSIRLDYTCAFHKTVNANFRNVQDDTTVIQKAGSPRNQSMMLSAVWFLN